MKPTAELPMYPSDELLPVYIARAQAQVIAELAPRVPSCLLEDYCGNLDYAPCRLDYRRVEALFRMQFFYSAFRWTGPLCREDVESELKKLLRADGYYLPHALMPDNDVCLLANIESVKKAARDILCEMNEPYHVMPELALEEFACDYGCKCLTTLV